MLGLFLVFVVVALVILLGWRLIDFKSKVHPRSSIKELEEIMENHFNLIDPMKLEFSNDYSYRGVIQFESKNKSVENKIPLKTMRFIKKDSYGYYVWEASSEEYKDVYNSSFKKFLKRKVEPMLTILKDDKSNEGYAYILIEYETPLATLNMTIKEEVEENGSVSAEVEKKAIQILSSFISDIKNSKGKIDELNNKLKEATIKSRAERLDFELEYIKRRKGVS